MIKKLLSAVVLASSLMSVSSVALSADTYVVGAGGTYRPFEYQDTNGELVGFDIDLIKAIAKEAGFDIKLINTPWDSLFASLENGERDLVISGITITDQRKLKMDFSHPYIPAEQVIIVPEGSDIKSLASLEKNKTVGVVNGSTADTVASKVLGQNSKSIRRFDNTPIMLQDLYEGGSDAAIGDIGVIKFYVKTNPGKKFELVRDENFSTQYFGIAVAKGNKAVLDKVNTGLKKVIDNGTYAEIYKKWFDSDVPTLPTIN